MQDVDELLDYCQSLLSLSREGRVSGVGVDTIDANPMQLDPTQLDALTIRHPGGCRDPGIWTDRFRPSPE